MMQICIKTNGPDLVITNCLAPHMWAWGGITKEDAYEIRQDYFQLFTELLLEQRDKKFHLVVGDLSTRLHAQPDNETDVIGKHIFGRGPPFAKNLPRHVKEQRMLLIAALRASDHIHMNSQFQKPDTKKVTRADWQTEGPPIYSDQICRDRRGTVKQKTSQRNQRHRKRHNHSIPKRPFPSHNQNQNQIV